MTPHGNFQRLVCLAVAILVCPRALGQTPAQDETAYQKAVDGVLAKLPPGTRHEFVMLPLRDGVKLATDVFLPEGPGPWPVSLLRTPYSRFDARVTVKLVVRPGPLRQRAPRRPQQDSPVRGLRDADDSPGSREGNLPERAAVRDGNG